MVSLFPFLMPTRIVAGAEGFVGGSIALLAGAEQLAAKAATTMGTHHDRFMISFIGSTTL